MRVLIALAIMLCIAGCSTANVGVLPEIHPSQILWGGEMRDVASWRTYNGIDIPIISVPLYRDIYTLLPVIDAVIIQRLREKGETGTDREIKQRVLRAISS